MSADIKLFHLFISQAFHAVVQHRCASVRQVINRTTSFHTSKGASPKGKGKPETLRGKTSIDVWIDEPSPALCLGTRGCVLPASIIEGI